VEAVRNNMGGYKDALANSNNIAGFQNGSPKEKKSMFAQTLGLPEDDKDLLKDKNIAAVNEAAQGAAKINAEGRDLSSQSYESLRAEINPKGLEKEKPQDLGKQKLIFQSIMGIIPTVLGYAIGGEQGGAIGGNIGVQGIKDVEGFYANAEAKQAAAAKEAKEDAWKERDYDLKGKELERKAAEDKLQADDRLERRDISRELLDLRKSGNGKQPSQYKSDDYKIASDLRDKYLSNAQTKRTQEIQEAYSRMASVAKVGSPASDMSLIYNYMKINDPGSTVREGEFATAEQAKGIDQRVLGAYNKTVKGERLTPDQRQDFLNQAKNLYDGQMQSQKKLENYYRNIGNKYGISEDQYLYTFNQDTAAPPPANNKPLDLKSMTREQKIQEAKKRLGQ